MPLPEHLDPLDTFELRPYLRAVARRRFFVAGCALALGVVAFVFGPGTDATVRVTQQIVLNDLSRYSPLLAPVNPAAEASLLRSRAVRAKVEDQLGAAAPVVNVESTPGSNVLTLSTTASDADQARKTLTLQVAAYREVRSSRLNSEVGTQRGLTERAGKDLDRQISSTSQVLEALAGTGKQQSSTLAAKLGAFFERKIDNTTNLRGLDAAERSGPARLAEPGSVQYVEGTSPTVPAALGLVVGALLGACLAIAQSVLQDRVSDRLDVAEALPNAPVLAESRRGRTGPDELEKVARGIARSRPLDGARRVAIVPGHAERLAAVASGLAEALQVEMGQRATVLVVTDPQQVPPGASDEGDRGDVAVMLVSAGRDSRRSVVSLADRLHVSGVPLAGVVLLDVRPTDLCAAPRKSRY